MRNPSPHFLGTPPARALTRAYAGAHFGKSLFWYASEILFAYFLSEVGKIPVRYMGVILAAGYFAGSAADLAVGMLLRQRLRDVLQACRVQCVGAVLSALMIVLLFLAAYVPPAWSAPYAMLASIGFRLAYALYDLPQNALLSLATSDGDSRARVSTLRVFFSGVASLLIASAIAPLLAAHMTLSQPARFLLLVALLSLAAIASSFSLLRAIKQAPAFPLAAVAQRQNLLQSLCGLPSGVWKLLVIIMLVSGASAIFLKIEPYFIAYVLQSPVIGASIAMMLPLGAILSQFVWRALLLRRDRAHCMLLATLGLLLSTLAFWLVSGNGPWMMGAALGFGAFSAGLGTVLWAAFGDIVSDSALGNAGLAYGLLTGAAKVALGISCLVLGKLLAGIDYQGVQSRQLLDLMSFPLIAVCLLVMLLIWRWRRLTARLPARLARY